MTADTGPALLSQHDRETVRNALPEFPINTLRRLQSLYGRLDYLRRDVTSFEGYTPYLTTDHIGDDATLLFVDMDMTDETPTVEDVSRAPYDPEKHGERLGYSYYYAAQGHDFSIVHRTTTGSENAAGNWAAKAFERWAPADETPPYDDMVVEEHPDGWIVEALRSVEPRDSTGNTPSLKDQVMDEYDTDASETMLVVRLRLTSGAVKTVRSVDESSETTLYWPGDLDICMAVMRSSRLGGYKTKDGVDGFSEGVGIDQNTEQEASLVGFASDPLKHFQQFQREKFSTFNPLTAWQSHPISENEALYIDASSDFLDACYSSINNHRIYQFPYFAEQVDVDQANALYELLQRLKDRRGNEESRESAMAVLRDHAREMDVDIDALRFWIVLQHYDQKDRRDVFREVPAATYQTLDDLADEHMTIVKSPLVGQAGLPQPTETLEDDDDRTPPTKVRPFIVPDTSEDYVRTSLASGWYLSVALPRVHAGTEDNPEPALDDPVTDVYRMLISGGQVDTETLLSLFMERFTDDVSDSPAVFRYLVTMQTTLLHTLALTNQLRPTNETQELLCRPPMTDDASNDSHSATDASTIDLDPDPNGASDDTAAGPSREDKSAYRLQRLREYIARDPSLNSTERRAAFTLGFYTGLVSNYQAGAESMTYTLDKKYPPDELSREGVMQLFQALISKSRQYVDNGTLYGDIAGELTESMEGTPTDWELSLVDIRFSYAKGLMFGLSHRADDAPIGLAAESDAIDVEAGTSNAENTD